VAYKAVIFDLDNTLLDFDRSWIESLRHSLAEHGLNPEDATFWEPFRDHFDRSNTLYWLERFERKLHNLEVLELSYRDAFRAMEAEHPAVAAVHPRDAAATY
jgi:beta-phosphoglucomutase-like phosphatase (HAD superfamily)